MEREGESVRIAGMKSLWMAAVLTVFTGGVWAEEKTKEEKKD